MYKFSASLIAGLMLSTAVSAATLTADETFGMFGIVTQDFSGNSESEGTVFIQGDASGTINVNDRVAGDNGNGFDDLIITGSVTSGKVNVGNGGNVTIGGDLNADLQLNGPVQTVTLGGTRTGGNFNQNQDILIENATTLNIPDVDFAQYAAESQQLAAQGGDAVTTNNSGQTVFGGSDVLSITMAELSSGTAVFDLPTGAPLLINVSGTSGTFGMNFSGFNGIQQIDAATSVVWNFYEATNLTLGTSLFGHILAPLAQITFNGSNEGNVIAAGVFVNGGEQHPLAYTGDISLTALPAQVPLPAGMVLLLSGLGALGATRMRRKA